MNPANQLSNQPTTQLPNQPTIQPTNQYGPLTKSIDIDEALMLIDLTREYESVAAWQDEALFRLPQASRQRRQEIVRAVRRKFLQTENDRFMTTPLLALLTTQTFDGRLKRDLLLAQYLRTTPLVWEAIQQVVLPHAEASARPLAGSEDATITLDEWIAFLDGRLNTTTSSTVVKTRSHITAHLTKFGLLEARPVPGDRFAKHFFARFYEPDPRAFWFSLALEFVEQGWTSRSLDYVTHESWTRISYCTKPAYARFVMDEAERVGLVVTDFFGSEKQVTFRTPPSPPYEEGSIGPDLVANVVETIRYG
jgi:hypothetical protein